MNFEEFSSKIISAVQFSNFSSFMKLLESNMPYSHRLCDVRYKKSRDTLAHIASASGCVDVLRYFGDSVCYLNLLKKENSDLKTPLHVAVQFCHLLCVQCLLSYHVPIDALKRGDWTPLMLSCTKNNVDIVQMLLEAGANSRLVNKDGWNSLHIACREGHADIIRCLLNCDPSLWKTKSRNGRTPLHTAALHGKVDAVQLLLIHGEYSADDADSCGTTPLMDAATANSVPIIKLLIENQKASPHAVDTLGRNSLHLASQAGSVDVISYLIEQHNVKINCKSFRNETPQDFAKRENQIEVLQLLEFYAKNKD